MLCLGVVDVCEKRFSSASLCFEKANTLASSMNGYYLSFHLFLFFFFFSLTFTF